MSCAYTQDPDNIGLEYWLSGCPANDSRSEFAKKRSQCYQLVLESLSVFEDKASQSTSQASAPIEDPETTRGQAYDLALSSEDEMFHSTLYDWLIERGHADELLAVSGPTLSCFRSFIGNKYRCGHGSLRLIFGGSPPLFPSTSCYGSFM